MGDENLVRRKLAELEVLLRQVGEYRGITADAYRRDWKTQRIVERTLQIEACLDVPSRVVADRSLKVPAAYTETFDVHAAFRPSPPLPMARRHHCTRNS